MLTSALRETLSDAGLGIMDQACRASTPTPRPGSYLSCRRLPACEPAPQGSVRAAPAPLGSDGAAEAPPALRPGSYQDQDPSVAWGLGDARHRGGRGPGTAGEMAPWFLHLSSAVEVSPSSMKAWSSASLREVVASDELVVPRNFVVQSLEIPSVSEHTGGCRAPSGHQPDTQPGRHQHKFRFKFSHRFGKAAPGGLPSSVILLTAKGLCACEKWFSPAARTCESVSAFGPHGTFTHTLNSPLKRAFPPREFGEVGRLPAFPRRRLRVPRPPHAEMRRKDCITSQHAASRPSPRPAVTPG
ncbi:unnamed protein product [Rangifer tarandus platyrhynchus]|uniref:Uncharacterized protein n=1 Tax=Rangifer tarandus platyrhynchus TaxID=3082113 RepID=A0ABN8ZYZ2_RANTA|nr:unnamed protein product [Rangifer tarandus platyrhynchus]